MSTPRECSGVREPRLEVRHRQAETQCTAAQGGKDAAARGESEGDGRGTPGCGTGDCGAKLVVGPPPLAGEVIMPNAQLRRPALRST